MNTLVQDKQIVAEILAGQQSSLSKLVAMYHSSMIRIARGFVGDANAEDVVQEAWLSVVRSLGTFRGQSSFKTWMTRITINCAKTRLRKEAKMPVYRASELDTNNHFSFDATGHWEIPPPLWEEETPEVLLQSEQLCSAVEKGIAKLPDYQRITLTLHDIEGIKMEEICNQLEISASNGRVILHRARIAIKMIVDNMKGS